MASRGARPTIPPAILAGGVAAALALVVVLVIAAPRVSPPPTDASATPGGSITSSAVASSPPRSPAASVLEPTPEPPVATVVSATTQVIEGPLGKRMGPTVVWTGAEAIIWGGWPETPREGISPPAEGAAYDPATGAWRMLPDSPIRGLSDHLSVWTGGEMLVWGGYTQIRPKPPSVGAAYNPKSGRWRTLAPGPMRWASGATSVWAEAEWVIAIARDQTDGIQVAAYDPRRDSWRELPRVPGSLSEENELVWTGSELLLMNSSAGMYRLAQGAEAWSKADVSSERVGRQVVWTGDRLFGLASNYPAEPSFVAWDSASDAWSELPVPEPFTHSGLFWTGDRLLLVEAALAFEPSSSTWTKLVPGSGFDPYEGVQVWAGDRLLALGGSQYHADGRPFGRAWIPEW